MVPDEPAENLPQALASMRFRVQPGRFALVGFPDPPGPRDWAALGDGPGQLVREGGETTLLVPEAATVALAEDHPQAAFERNLVWICFEAPMSWEVVGFLALVTGRLAAAGISIGAVCGYSRDHLFLDAAHLPAALAVLRELFPESSRPDA